MKNRRTFLDATAAVRGASSAGVRPVSGAAPAPLGMPLAIPPADPPPDAPAQIGPAAVHEIDALAALMRAVIEPLGYYNARAKRAELMKYDADGLRALAADDPAAVLVARDGARLVGFCVSRYDDATVWLSWFGTASDARGRGIGAALLAALGRTIPGRGAHKVWCDSRVENVESKAVLERAGFVRVATLTNHWFGQDFYLWEWYPNGTGAA